MTPPINHYRRRLADRLQSLPDVRTPLSTAAEGSHLQVREVTIADVLRPEEHSLPPGILRVQKHVIVSYMLLAYGSAWPNGAAYPIDAESPEADGARRTLAN